MRSEKDKRVEERFPVSAHSACIFASPVLEDFGPVKLKNISLRGVGLITPHGLEVGMLMAVKLSNPTKNFHKTALLRVIHTTPQAGGSYLIGGEWETPLTYDELCMFVM